MPVVAGPPLFLFGERSDVVMLGSFGTMLQRFFRLGVATPFVETRSYSGPKRLRSVVVRRFRNKTKAAIAAIPTTASVIISIDVCRGDSLSP
jgi:hypothetical protein